MLATRSEIINYIPQRDPFIVVHDILRATDEFTETQFEVFLKTLLKQQPHRWVTFVKRKGRQFL